MKPYIGGIILVVGSLLMIYGILTVPLDPVRYIVGSSVAGAALGIGAGKLLSLSNVKVKDEEPNS